MTSHKNLTHRGGCHCGTVRFEVEAPARLKATRCNCSMCRMTGFVHLIVKKEKFHLLQGVDSLTTYSFNTHTAKHTFCKICGVKSFYTPRSHPDGISVNVSCLDTGTIEAIDYTDFDGRNWEDNIARLHSNPGA
tara:strand:+ start:80 stop:481 length:402 start_codon:yes stop_codon:yes gene_type:complete